MSSIKSKEIEAILFASGKEIFISDLKAKLIDLTKEDLKETKAYLAKKYDDQSGVLFVETTTTWQLCSNNVYEEVVTDFLKRPKERVLSKSLLETLALITYNQPITKAQIVEVRGDCDYAISRLMELNLIQIVGKLESAMGKPRLFGTTDNFLRRFKLRSIDDLPERVNLENKLKIMKTQTEELDDNSEEVDELFKEKERHFELVDELEQNKEQLTQSLTAIEENIINLEKERQLSKNEEINTYIEQAKSLSKKDKNSNEEFKEEFELQMVVDSLNVDKNDVESNEDDNLTLEDSGNNFENEEYNEEIDEIEDVDDVDNELLEIDDIEELNDTEDYDDSDYSNYKFSEIIDESDLDGDDDN